MFHITEQELTAALTKLPPPDSVAGTCYTVPVSDVVDNMKGRSLTFRKVTSDIGFTQWFLHHTPWPLSKDESTVYHQPNPDPTWPFAEYFDKLMCDGAEWSADHTFEDIDPDVEQYEWEAKVSAAVDMMVETLTKGDQMDKDGQCALAKAMQLLIPLFDLENCLSIGYMCRDREEDLLREARRPA